MAKKKDEEKKALSRREFLKDTGMVVGGAALTMGALSLAGCASPEAETTTVTTTKTETATPWLPSKWDYEADVVVVGYGAAGSMAAIEAHDAGADVIILEKMAEGFEGGSMGCCGGLVGVKGLLGTPSLVGFTQDDVRALTWGEADSVTIQKYLDGLDELQDWFDSIGLVTNIIDGPPYGKSARIQPEPGWLNGGHTWFMAVKSQVTQRGIRVMYETPGKKLIQDPVTKEILGVIAEKNGQQIAVKAKKGVILATGTYVSNPKMVHDWIAPGVDIASVSSPANTGDGLKMAMEAGAYVAPGGVMNPEWHSYSFKVPSKLYNTAVVSEFKANSYIFVDKYAHRFTDEKKMLTHDKRPQDALYFDGAWNNLPEKCEYTHIPFFVIFDEATKEAGRIATAPTSWGWRTTYGIYEWSADNNAEISKGWVVKADTIQELATKISGTDWWGKVWNVDPAGLQDLINKYNGYCRAGNDPDFNRSGSTLVPIETPPYYAAELCCTLIYNICGLMHNAKAQTLDQNGKPIPRLYHAGDVGQFQRNKPQGVAGAMVFGRIAALDAAAATPWG